MNLNKLIVVSCYLILETKNGDLAEIYTAIICELSKLKVEIRYQARVQT